MLADDTDFLIFPGQWRYFSLQNINFETMTTVEFSRRALRKCLNVNDRQLIILSTLAGNDVIKHHQVWDFQQTFSSNAEEKFPWLANYIREKLMLPYDHLVDEISMLIWNNKNWQNKNQVKDSLDFYNIVSHDIKDRMVCLIN